MAIVTIKYDLNEPEDRQALERAMYSLDMAAYIFEVLMNGKRHFKHKENATIDDVFEYLWREAREHKIDIDKLIE
ncbi:MAG: hypothetical protein ACK52I_01920 [Pseudomonadota bacterium]|jgi:hypothetical protein